MKQTYGNLRRTFLTEMPPAYDRATRMAYIDFQPDTRPTMHNGEGEDADGKPTDGYSGFAVQTDGVIDYGHLKSLHIPRHLSPTMSFTPSKPRSLSQIRKLFQLSASSFMPSTAPMTSR